MAEKIWNTLPAELAQAAELAGRSVVAVHGWRYPASGVFLSTDSIITVNHALRGEEARVVLASGERVSARIAGRDPGTDLLVLRLEQRVQSGQVRWGTEAKPRIGGLTLAIARTWRGNIVSSSGILSGLIPPPFPTQPSCALHPF